MHAGFVVNENCVHTGVLSQSLSQCFDHIHVVGVGCSPVSVSVVVMCEWQQVMLFPEGPGPCRCPVSSSYTVYTKLCMYKIEKSAKETQTY